MFRNYAVGIYYKKGKICFNLFKQNFSAKTVGFGAVSKSGHLLYVRSGSWFTTRSSDQIGTILIEQCHGIFDYRFFTWISFSSGPDCRFFLPIRDTNFTRRTLPVSTSYKSEKKLNILKEKIFFWLLPIVIHSLVIVSKKLLNITAVCKVIHQQRRDKYVDVSWTKCL